MLCSINTLLFEQELNSLWIVCFDGVLEDSILHQIIELCLLYMILGFIFEVLVMHTIFAI